MVSILRQERTVSALQEHVARLYEEARDDVYRYLLTLGLHPPRAQEAVQEVFLRLYATLKKGEEIDNPRGWVFRVAHNYGLKVRERQVSEEPFDPGLEATAVGGGGKSRERVVGAGANDTVSSCGGGAFGTAEALPLPAHGGPPVSGDRGGPRHQRLARWANFCGARWCG